MNLPVPPVPTLYHLHLTPPKHVILRRHAPPTETLTELIVYHISSIRRKIEIYRPLIYKTFNYLVNCVLSSVELF
ncbi:MAG: hypothetical protein ACKESC_00955 [Candidatus Hodgkinia cicadicola]